MPNVDFLREAQKFPRLIFILTGPRFSRRPAKPDFRDLFSATYSFPQLILTSGLYTIPARFLWIPNDLRGEQVGVSPKRCHAGAVQDAMRINRICFVRQGVGVRLRTCVRLRRCPPSSAAVLYAQRGYMRKRYVFQWFSLKHSSIHGVRITGGALTRASTVKFENDIYPKRRAAVPGARTILRRND